MSLCSEDGASLEDELQSPTDVSEDSVEVRVTPIAGPRKPTASASKRKPSEPRRVTVPPSASCKRRRPASPMSPFRPWSVPSAPQDQPQDEPLALVKTRDGSPQEVTTAAPTVPVIPRNPRGSTPGARFSVESIIGDPAPTASTSTSVRNSSPPLDRGGGSGSGSGSVVGGGGGGGGGSGRGAQQRNYKNMTRERRIEANARERTRVHTISAAFDTLRRAVPAYSHSQKLSKLSVLRIACSYILTLSRVAGMDYSADQSRPPVQDCVDLVTRTIQTEGKLRRNGKRDD